MNRETRLGLYIVGSIVVLFGLLGYGTFALLTQGVPTLARMERDRRFGDNGTANANLYVEGPFVKDYAASAVFELPPTPDGERDSPSVQLGFNQIDGNVQAGLIRTPQDKFVLKAFVAFTTPGNGQQIHYLNRLEEGPHSIELRVRGDTTKLFVDGLQRFALADARLLPQRSNPWLFLGTSATFVGNSAYGTISDIRVRRDGDATLRADRPSCIISNGGIHLRPYGAGWILSGTSMRSVPIDYESCSSVFARHHELARTSSLATTALSSAVPGATR